MLSLHFSSPDMEAFISGVPLSPVCVPSVCVVCSVFTHVCRVACICRTYTCVHSCRVGGVEHACVLYGVRCVTRVVCCVYAHACMSCAHAPRVVCGAYTCCMCHVHTHTCAILCYMSACACVLRACSCVDACIVCAWVWCGVWCVCMRVCHTP